MTPEVLIVPTGTANIASVMAAFERLGARPRVTADLRLLERADRIVLPGVGTFAAAADRLDQLGLREVLRERLGASRPTLAICLGLQLLCTASEESPGTRGLGVIQETVTRFPASLRAPQFGWNRVTPVDSDLIEPGHAYFANTYRLAAIPPGWAGALTDYGGNFASALERGAVLACQFHPEVSGDYGHRLLSRWLNLPGEVR